MVYDCYRPYFEAVQQILHGHPVQDLEEIRSRCNEAFLKTPSPEVPEESRWYAPEAILISFLADAENRILLGEDSVEAYRGFHGLPPADLRQRGRKILEQVIQQYFR